MTIFIRFWTFGSLESSVIRTSLTVTQFGAKNTSVIDQSVASTMAVKKGRKGPSTQRANKLDYSDTGMFRHNIFLAFNRDIITTYIQIPVCC